MSVFIRFENVNFTALREVMGVWEYTRLSGRQSEE